MIPNVFGNAFLTRTVGTSLEVDIMVISIFEGEKTNTQIHQKSLCNCCLKSSHKIEIKLYHNINIDRDRIGWNFVRQLVDFRMHGHILLCTMHSSMSIGDYIPKKAQETRTGMSQNHMRLDIRIAWCVQHPHTCITQCNSYYSRICFKAMVIVLQLVLYENAQQYRALMMIVQSYCQRSGGSTTSHQFLLQHM
jgi:hypothetical protein